eukprot:4598-Eustigmatos_ZCMA.PRE.1
MVRPAAIRGLAIPRLPRPTSVGRPVLSTPLSGTGDLSRGAEVEQLLDEVDELQYQAFRCGSPAVVFGSNRWCP